jgi:hypothetical protein
MTITIKYDGEPTQQRALAVQLDGRTVHTLPLAFLEARGHDVSNPQALETQFQPQYEAAYAGVTFDGLKAQADAAFSTEAAKDRYTPEQRQYHADQALRGSFSTLNNKVDLRATAEVVEHPALRA